MSRTWLWGMMDWLQLRGLKMGEVDAPLSQQSPTIPWAINQNSGGVDFKVDWQKSKPGDSNEAHTYLSLQDLKRRKNFRQFLARFAEIWYRIYVLQCQFLQIWSIIRNPKLKSLDASGDVTQCRVNQSRGTHVTVWNPFRQLRDVFKNWGGVP